MDKMLVAVFDSETRAFEGSRALRELHDRGSLVTYAVAVIVKHADGLVNTSQAFGQDALGVLHGTATASLIELLGRSVGIADGAASGGILVSSIIDGLANASVGADFVDEVAHYLTPGKSAVVAEVDEERIMPADIRMETLGGVVFRRVRSEFHDIQIQKDITAFQAEIESLEAELKEATGNAKAKLKQKIEAAHIRLRGAKNWAKCRAGALKREAEAKIILLQERAAHSHGELKTKFEDLAGQVRANYVEQATNLNRTWQVGKETLTA